MAWFRVWAFRVWFFMVWFRVWAFRVWFRVWVFDFCVMEWLNFGKKKLIFFYLMGKWWIWGSCD